MALQLERAKLKRNTAAEDTDYLYLSGTLISQPGASNASIAGDLGFLRPDWRIASTAALFPLDLARCTL